jgi:hypothetical protein
MKPFLSHEAVRQRFSGQYHRGNFAAREFFREGAVLLCVPGRVRGFDGAGQPVMLGQVARMKVDGLGDLADGEQYLVGYLFIGRMGGVAVYGHGVRFSSKKGYAILYPMKNRQSSRSSRFFDIP